tara:strand:+ start:37 stop:366 length:330 start_codon:yes stop_codon:yes gene_type:complete
MEINGKIVKVLPESGTTNAGKEWKKINVILLQPGEYGKEVCITVFGDKAYESFNGFKVGDTVDVSVNVSSREFNNKYYTTLDGWRWANKNSEVHQDDFVTSENDENLPF